MAQKYNIEVKIISQEGHCGAGHKVGDKWTIEGITTPEGMCLLAVQAMFPNFWALKFGGILPWEPDSDVAKVACPDAENPLSLELRRIPKE